MKRIKHNYGTAILSAFEYLLDKYPDVFVIGQGLWSPWYVGNSMTDLDKKYGEHRIIDTPVSESVSTGAAIGASLCGMNPIIVHPRMDFMLYAMDAIVNQAAKWSSMFGGQSHPGVTIRGIINRGGEQGAQHSQALHSWFAHIPGLRVVMPSTVSDARDLLISSVLCDDPVVYIDDRWLYEQTEELLPITEIDLKLVKPKIVHAGNDLTIVASGFSTSLASQVHFELKKVGYSVEIIDVRVISPLDPYLIIQSVKKTKRLLVLDGGWSCCGFSSELIASVCENISPNTMISAPSRITLPAAPAPSSGYLENKYYPSIESIIKTSLKLFKI